ncbi:MAG: hypothetical protein J0L60_13570 [Ignavibacteria bacterium]|nr:hypothetical protein [Ignavibacteria bacterium]
MLVGIIVNEDHISGDKWIVSCKKKNVDFRVLEITDPHFFEKVIEYKCDFYLLKPPGAISYYKTLFDEKIMTIVNYLNCKVFPSLSEVLVYENKRFLAYFLESNNLPHPTTYVAYSVEAARKVSESLGFPCVAKTAIGASGSGVEILRTSMEFEKYVNRGFSSTGIKRRFGPNRVTGTSKKWISKAINDPVYFITKIKEYRHRSADAQKGFVILQKFVPHDFEWRVVRIGDSYFAHKKIKHGEMASGSKGIDYVNPPKNLLDFVRSICEKFEFRSMAVDLFEDGNGGYLINELQTIFGHVQSHIMEVNGLPGRYLFINNEWCFEAGDFNTNESYDLRLQSAIELYAKNR